LRRPFVVLSVKSRRRMTGEQCMCDYSLEHVASRPAKVGDVLVSTDFSYSFTRGFAAAGKPDMAVCLLPGTEVVFEKDVRIEPAIPFLPGRRTGQRLARFRRVNEDRPHAHHDALELPDGRIVLTTRLCSGQRATVLQLPAPARDEGVVAMHQGLGLLPSDRAS
jgi:hypothetical protein